MPAERAQLLCRMTTSLASAPAVFDHRAGGAANPAGYRIRSAFFGDPASLTLQISTGLRAAVDWVADAERRSHIARTGKRRANARTMRHPGSLSSPERRVHGDVRTL